jgi:hypothetical protein
MFCRLHKQVCLDVSLERLERTASYRQVAR